MVEIWGSKFTARIRRRGHMGDECCVCGKPVSLKTALVVTASPVTGKLVPTALVGTPEGNRLEASGYYVGSECAKTVRRDHPESL